MFDSVKWFARKPPPEVGCVAESYLERAQHAQKDLLLILEYLAERTERTADEDVTDEDIQRAARLCATPFGSLDEAQKGKIDEIWVLMNRLSPLIAPATVEGLRRAMGSDVLRWSGFKVPIMVASLMLFLTLVVQAYTLFGSQTLDRLKEKVAEENEVYAQINALEEHRPELLAEQIQIGLTKFNKDGKIERSQWSPTALEHRHLKYRVDAIKGSMKTLYKDMYDWNGVLAAPLARHFYGREPGEYWGFDCDPSDKDPCTTWVDKLNESRQAVLNKTRTEDTDASAESDQPNGADPAALWKAAPFGHIQIKYGSEVFAQSNLETLRGVFLPVLYGALGACVWLLRERYRQLRELRWRSPVGGEYLQRLFLGAVLGAALGYLNVSSFLPETVANISLTGLAFIIGYNVEAIFSQFDRMFKPMRAKRPEEEQERARRRERTRQAGPTPPPSGAPASSAPPAPNA